MMNPALQILEQISISLASTKNNSKRTSARQELKKGTSTGQKELKQETTFAKSSVVGLGMK
jgi:hypothetical protein